MNAHESLLFLLNAYICVRFCKVQRACLSVRKGHFTTQLIIIIITTNQKQAALTKGVVVALDKSSNPMTDGFTRLLAANAGDGGVFKQLVQAGRHHAAN